MFAECCSLISVGVGQAADGSNVLAPGAQLGHCAFESCLLLRSITFAMDHTSRLRSLPEGSFCGAGIRNLCLPCDFQSIGPRACENCKRLIEVNLLCAEIHALLRFTFAHCEALTDVWLPPRLTSIGKEVFIRCIALQELAIPAKLRDIGIRAFVDVSSYGVSHPLTWGRPIRSSKQKTMPSSCVLNLNKHRG